MARNIIIKGKTTDATEQELPEDKEVMLPATGGVGAAADEIREIETGPAVFDLNGKAARLAFMEEKVDVMVHESADPNAEPVVHVAVNGSNQFFPRGQVVTCKRKYLEVLARAKEVGINTREALDRDGNRTTVIGKHAALRFPFSVMRDENPKGATWLKSVLAQG